MTRRVLAWITRWLGGDPVQVELLSGWLQRAADGLAQLEQERRLGPQFPIDFRVIELFLIMMAVLYSIGLAVVTVFAGWTVGVWGLSAVHLMVVTFAILTTARQRLLDEDDVRVLGWWPVSMRDVTLARLGLLLGPVVRFTLAIAVAPLLVLVVVGRPVVLVAVLQAAGLIVQTLGLLVLALLAGRTIQRRCGIRAAQRVFWPVMLIASFGPCAMLALVVPREAPEIWIQQPPWYAMLLPPAWAPAWGLLFRSSTAWIGVVTGTTITLLLGNWILRRELSGSRGQTVRPMTARSRAFPLVTVIERMLWPFAPGKEGWVMRRLTAAHLRDDPLVLGGLLMGPLTALMLAWLFRAAPEMSALLAQPLDSPPIRSGFVFLLGSLALPLSAIPSLVYSSDARAAWILATAELDPRRMVRSQRGVARGISLCPLLLILGWVEWRAGAPLRYALSDAVLVWLVWEMAAAALQRLYPVMPFSRPRHGGGTEALPYGLLIMPMFIFAAIWTCGVYELVPYAGGKLLTWSLLLWGILDAHRAIDRQAAHSGLPIELAPPAADRKGAATSTA